MKRFLVKHAKVSHQEPVERFDTIEEAIAYCNSEVKEAQLYNGDRSMRDDYYWYEVYDTSIGEWDNDEVDELSIDEASVYVTHNYWA